MTRFLLAVSCLAVIGCGVSTDAPLPVASRTCQEIIAYPWVAERNCYLHDRPALIECVRSRADQTSADGCWLSSDRSLVTIEPAVSSTALMNAGWTSCGGEPVTCDSLD